MQQPQLQNDILQIDKREKCKLDSDRGILFSCSGILCLHFVFGWLWNHQSSDVELKEKMLTGMGETGDILEF